MDEDDQSLEKSGVKKGTLRMRNWRRRNRERDRANQKKYRESHRAQGVARRKKWRDANKERIRAYSNKRHRENPFEKNLRNRIYIALRKNRRWGKAMELLGCSVEDFWIYLESLFEVGMNRENYGKIWELDHIVPCAVFDLSKPDHQKRCFHFSNQRPMFVGANRSKGHKVITNQFNLL